MTVKKINWDNDVVTEAKKELVEYIRREDSKPTLRTIYYLLISNGAIPATNSSYKSLSAAIVKAKKEGRFPLDAFIDEGRRTIINFLPVTSYITPEEYIDILIENVKEAPLTYRIPRWYNQRHYVEVWIEKATISGIFKNYLEGRDVPISVNKGNSGFQFFTDNCKRLKQIYDKYRDEMQIHVLYFGDNDPSGENMSVHLKKELGTFKLENVIDFQRIAVNLDQIVKYDLIFKPQDLDTMQKLLADPNIDKFTYKLKSNPCYLKIKAKLQSDPYYLELKARLIDHTKVIERLKKKSKGDPILYRRLREELIEKIDNIDFIIVELDALAASKQHPKLLKNMVLKAVDNYFDESIYDEALNSKDHRPESIDRLVHEKIRFLDDKIDDKIE
jgi:hypothetical protein